ncbi:helix-turn-helix domain-containing protein [Actinomadura gamaensis]|uniref:Helix-turn-helix domain-containing protein n=1 Tax=Actinomadura gamaensis TaxID=1763541 RepID=A0ABV9TWC9_9ACTN
MPELHAPTVRGRRLARELRQHREHAGLTPDQVVTRLGWSRSKISRIESGRTRPSVADVTAVLDLFGVTSPVRDALVQLARDVQKRGWWTTYADLWDGSYVGLEDEASRIRSYQVQFVPGLLQTPDYARAVISAGRPDRPAEVDRRVRARMARKSVLARSDAPTLTVVLDEGLLRRPLGGRDVMREQLYALVAASQGGSVTIRVLPTETDTLLGAEGPFVLLSFEESDPDVAYSEGMSGCVYMESQEQVSRCRVTFERLFETALSPEKSVALIETYAKE